MSYKPTIAVFGAHGTLAKPILDALTSPLFSDHITYPIKVVTRSAKNSTSTDKLKYVESNNAETLTSHFKSIDVIISLAGADPSVAEELSKAVIAAKPKLYIPSQFGCEIDKIDIFPGFLEAKQIHSQTVRKAGIKVIDVITGFFSSPGSWAYEIVQHAGIDPENKTVTYRGDPDSPIATTDLQDLGKSVASIATNPNPSSLPDKIRIYSNILSQKIIAARYSKDHGVKLTESYKTNEELAQEIKENYAKGFDVSKFFFYLQAVAAQGVGKGVAYEEDERELVNPNESVFKWTKY